jgi:hypothetical protein
MTEAARAKRASVNFMVDKVRSCDGGEKMLSCVSTLGQLRVYIPHPAMNGGLAPPPQMTGNALHPAKHEI